MSFGITSLVIGLASIAYSLYSGLTAAAAARKAKKKAKEAADKAKGFQVVVEGSAEPAPLLFGRGKIGGTRVHAVVRSNYTYLEAPDNPALSIGWFSPTGLVDKSINEGASALNVTGDDFNITKSGLVDEWDTFLFSEENVKAPIIQATISSNTHSMLFGFSGSNAASLRSIAFCWYIGKDGMAIPLTCDQIATLTKINYLFNDGPQGTNTFSKFVCLPGDNLKIANAGTQINYYINNELKYSTYGKIENLHTMLAFKTSGAKLSNFSLEGSLPLYKTFITSSRSEDNDGYRFQLVNDDPAGWTGGWALHQAASPDAYIWYCKRSDPDTWKRSWKKHHSWRVEKVDIIWCYSSTATPSIAPPKLSELFIEFPDASSYDDVWHLTSSIYHSKTKNRKREYLFTQQVISQGRLSNIVACDVDDYIYSSPKFAFGQMIQTHFGGGLANPWMAANDTARTESRFTSVAYATCCFKMDRDEPQYAGIPSVTFYCEGNLVRDTDGSGELPVSYSNNSARVLLEYLRNDEFGVGLSSEEIDYPSFKRAIEICDRLVLETVSYTGTFWQNKHTTKQLRLFECNLALNSSDSFRTNTNKILSTMGAHVDLVWSGGKYKLQLSYPQIYKDNKNYSTGEVVQVVDAYNKVHLYTSSKEINSGNPPLESPTFWNEDVVKAYITDDDLLLDSQVIVTWPSMDTKLNYMTVRFFNEDKNFKEDTISWPEKVPLIILHSSAFTVDTLNHTVTFVEAMDFKAGTKILFSKTLGDGVAFTIASDMSASNTASITFTDEAAVNSMIKTKIYSYFDDGIYDSYLSEDMNTLLELDEFAEGITSPQHAKAYAEQKVRLSRHTTLYKFDISIENYDLEPGDIISLVSEVFEINQGALKIDKISAEVGGKLSLECSSFDARLLAWNIDDNVLDDFNTDDYIAPPINAENLDIVETEVYGLKEYSLIWDDPLEGFNVSYYRVLQTKDLYDNITSTTVWVELGTTANNTFKLPILDGYYCFAVVAVTSDGASPTRLNHAFAYQWPLIEKEFIKSEQVSSSVITVLISNDTVIFNLDGSEIENIDYSISGTNIQVFEETQELTYNGVGTLPSTYNIVATTDLIELVPIITIGSISASSGYALISPHSNMLVAKATITYTITGMKQDYTPFTKTVQQKLYKIKDGKDIQIQWIDATTSLSYFKQGVYAPSSITFKGISKTSNEDLTTYSGFFKIYEDDVLVQTSISAETSATFNILTALSNVRCELYDESNNLLDTETVRILKAEPGAVVSTLSNSNYNVLCNSVGEFLNDDVLLASTTDLFVKESDQPLDYVTSITAAGQFTVTIIDNSVVSDSASIIDNTTYITIPKITSISSDFASRSFNITYKNSEGETNTIIAYQYFVRVKNGAPGKSYHTATIYKQVEEIVVPPTGGTYNFFTGLLTPPVGWSISAPDVDMVNTWACDFTFSGIPGDGDITAGNWSNLHIDAVKSPNGESSYVIEVYKQDASPGTPSGGSYNFDSGVFSSPIGWSFACPSSSTTPTYMSYFRFATSTPGVTVNAGTWSEPVIVNQNGANGSDGSSLFITYNDSSAESAPNNPTGDGTTNGWHTTPTTAAVWVSQKTALSISEGTWSVPIRIKGTDGVNAPKYQLIVSGGVRGHIWDADGANPVPPPEAFIADLYLDGILLSSGVTYAWTVSTSNSLLNNPAILNAKSFTPGTPDASFVSAYANNYVQVTATHNGNSIVMSVNITCNKIIPSYIGETSITNTTVSSCVLDGNAVLGNKLAGTTILSGYNNRLTEAVLSGASKTLTSLSWAGFTTNGSGMIYSSNCPTGEPISWTMVTGTTLSEVTLVNSHPIGAMVIQTSKSLVKIDPTGITALDAAGETSFNLNSASGKMTAKGAEIEGIITVTGGTARTEIDNAATTASWPSISSIPPNVTNAITAAQATTITKDTVTTSFINALNVTAYSVNSNWVYAGGLTAAQISAVDFIKSANYDGSTTDPFGSPGTSGWCFAKTGGGALHNVKVRGDIEATSLKVDALEVVETHHIADEAVTTVVTSQNAASISTSDSGNGTVIATVTVVIQSGYKVILLGQGNIADSNSIGGYSRLIRGSTVLTSQILPKTMVPNGTYTPAERTRGPFSIIWVDAPTAGTYTYNFCVDFESSTNNRVLIAMVIKK